MANGFRSARGHTSAIRASPQALAQENDVDGVAPVAELPHMDPYAAPHKKRRLQGPSVNVFLRDLLSIVSSASPEGSESSSGSPTIPAIRRLLRENGISLGEDVDETDVDEDMSEDDHSGGIELPPGIASPSGVSLLCFPICYVSSHDSDDAH